jgi:hypothetical protein
VLHSDGYAHSELPIKFSSIKSSGTAFVSCGDVEENFKNIVYVLQEHCNSPIETGVMRGSRVGFCSPLEIICNYLLGRKF